MISAIKPKWCKITTNNDLLLYTVNKHTGCTATRLYLRVQVTGVSYSIISSDTANFVWYKLSNWTDTWLNR